MHENCTVRWSKSNFEQIPNLLDGILWTGYGVSYCFRVAVNFVVISSLHGSALFMHDRSAHWECLGLIRSYRHR